MFEQLQRVSGLQLGSHFCFAGCHHHLPILVPELLSHEYFGQNRPDAE